MADLQIVSLNAWGGACWTTLAPWLRESTADVLCLQEVTRALEPSPPWLRYEDPYRRLEQRSDLFRDVCDARPEALGRFVAAARGPLHGDRIYRSEHGLGLWVAPHLAIIGAWEGFAHGAFRADGWGAEPVPRAMQMVRLATGTGTTLVVAHLHGLRDPAGKGDTPARKRQWQRVCAALHSFAQPHERIILAGDFNILPDSAAFDSFTGHGLRDLIRDSGITDTRTSLYTKPQRFADYMLVSAAVDVLSFEAPAEPEVSDHRPLCLKIFL